MRAGRIRLAPSVPGIDALGASSFEDLLGVGGALSEEARARLVDHDDESVLLRVPLPGTPDEDDVLERLTGRPRGAGTGFVYVRRYHAARPARALAARFTPPRSESFAAREWNLLCHLRGQGVGTPEPLAVGEERAALFARRSVLVTRELASTLSLAAWLAAPRDDAERRAAIRAIGSLLARLHRARVHLPRLRAEHLRLSLASRRTDGGALGGAIGCCEHDAPPLAGKLRFTHSVEATIASVRGGRVLAAPSLELFGDTLARLGASAPRAGFRAGELLRIFLAATRGLARAERRALLHRLRAETTRWS